VTERAGALRRLTFRAADAGLGSDARLGAPGMLRGPRKDDG
jgi:hypothetical protein